MATAFKSSSTSGTDDDFNASCTIPVPAGAAAGDIALCGIEQWHETPTHQTITAPAGFTKVGELVQGNEKIEVWWKRLTGADTGSYVFSTPNQRWKAGNGLLLTGGLAAGNPVADSSFTGVASSTISATSVDAGAVEPFLYQFVGNQDSTTITTPSTGFTVDQNSNFAKTSHRIPGTTGIFNVSDGTLSGSTVHVAVLVAIIPEPTGGVDQDLEIGFLQQITSFFPMALQNQDNVDVEVGFLDSAVQLFVPDVVNQANQDLSVGFVSSTAQLFTPSLDIGDQFIEPGFIDSTAQLFAPSLTLQASQDLEIGLISSTAVVNAVAIESQINDTLAVALFVNGVVLFTPQVFNEGDELFEPTLVGNGSLVDRIMAGLIEQGFLTGTIADRERARLLAKLGLVEPAALSMADLYSLAIEPYRIIGIQVLEAV